MSSDSNTQYSASIPEYKVTEYFSFPFFMNSPAKLSGPSARCKILFIFVIWRSYMSSIFFTLIDYFWQLSSNVFNSFWPFHRICFKETCEGSLLIGFMMICFWLKSEINLDSFSRKLSGQLECGVSMKVCWYLKCSSHKKLILRNWCSRKCEDSKRISLVLTYMNFLDES